MMGTRSDSNNPHRNNHVWKRILPLVLIALACTACLPVLQTNPTRPKTAEVKPAEPGTITAPKAVSAPATNSAAIIVVTRSAAEQLGLKGRVVSMPYGREIYGAHLLGRLFAGEKKKGAERASEVNFFFPTVINEAPGECRVGLLPDGVADEFSPPSRITSAPAREYYTYTENVRRCGNIYYSGDRWGCDNVPETQVDTRYPFEKEGGPMLPPSPVVLAQPLMLTKPVCYPLSAGSQPSEPRVEARFFFTKK